MDNVKRNTLLALVLLPLFSQFVFATVNNDSPPFALSIEQALEWQPDNHLAERANVSTTLLAQRFIHKASQLEQHRDTQSKVLLAPDGINNFANYTSTQNQFNLYNFSHWSYIDTLNWFAGTANQTINIPAKPWVDTAHKNGVKVIGTVFLAISQYGGSAETVKHFLQRDSDGHFVMADKLIEIAQFYKFDGWLMNQETDLTAVKDTQGKIIKGQKNLVLAKHLASEMQEFMVYLTSIAPAGMEIHWYDSMLPNGTVRWQNELNAKNVSFIQSAKNAQPASHAMFVNYWWNAQMVEDSVALIESVERSPYDLYFGVDLWPQRNAQKAFVEKRWLQAIFPDVKQPGRTSIALFANNFNYNFDGDEKTPVFSTFRRNKSDIKTFYDTETRLFAGDDLNLVNEDSAGWPGLGQYVAARSSIQSLPFHTYFNTGHGMKLWSGGEIKNSKEWHNMGYQDHLPTWQFAIKGNTDLSIGFDFTEAFEGGSSLLIKGVKRKHSSLVSLYKTKLKLTAASQLSVIYKMKHTESMVSIVLDFENAPSLKEPLLLNSQSWNEQKISLTQFQEKTISRISFEIEANEVPILFNLGGIRIE